MSNTVFAQVDSEGDIQVRSLRGQLHDLVQKQADERGDWHQRDHALSWEISVVRHQIWDATGVDPLAPWL